MKKSILEIQAIVLALVLLAAGACYGSQSESTPPHVTFSIESQVMNELRVINVYLPPGYDESATEKYSVLYMPDGGIKEDFPHIANTIDAGIRAGQMRPIVLVGIENTQRRRDMSGPTSVARDREIAPVVGGSAVFREFIATELIPEIHSRYRITDESGIIGESAAGLFIVETFFLQPELFDVYIAISPSLWWNNEGLVRQAADRLSGWSGLDIDLYLTSADETDIAPPVSRLAEELQKNCPSGIRWTYKPRSDLRHNNIYRSVAPAVLREFYPPK